MNQDTFREFYDRTAPGLWRFIFHGCRDAVAADDIMQESFIKFLRYVDPEREVAEWKAYLYRIAGSRIIAHFRQNRMRPDELTEDLPASDGLDRESAMDVRHALNDMDTRQRDMLWLAHVEGFSHVEIAGILGVAENSVRVLLHRARSRLKTLLRERGAILEETQ